MFLSMVGIHVGFEIKLINWVSLVPVPIHIGMDVLTV